MVKEPKEGRLVGEIADALSRGKGVDAGIFRAGESPGHDAVLEKIRQGGRDLLIKIDPYSDPLRYMEQSTADMAAQIPQDHIRKLYPE